MTKLYMDQYAVDAEVFYRQCVSKTCVMVKVSASSVSLATFAWAGELAMILWSRFVMALLQTKSKPFYLIFIYLG